MLWTPPRLENLERLLSKVEQLAYMRCAVETNIHLATNISAHNQEKAELLPLRAATHISNSLVIVNAPAARTMFCFGENPVAGVMDVGTSWHRDVGLKLATLILKRFRQHPHCTLNHHTTSYLEMASVYKSMAKSKANGKARDEDGESKPKNRQRVLILTSRGVTYR